MHLKKSSKCPRVAVAVVLIFFGLFTSCTVKTTKKPLGAPDPIKIQDIRVADGIDKTIIELESEEPILYTSFRLSNPDRLVIEMADVSFGKYRDKIQVSEGPVRSIMLASSDELDVSRLEFTLDGLVKTDVRPEGLNIVVEVTRIEQASGPGKPNTPEARHEKSFIFFGDKQTPSSENNEPLPLIEELKEQPLEGNEILKTEPVTPAPLVPITPSAKAPSAITAQKQQTTDNAQRPPQTETQSAGLSSAETLKQTNTGANARFITAVRFVEGDPLQLFISSDGQLAPKLFFVGEKKERLVIDFAGVQSKMKKNTIPGDSLFVKRIRVGKHPDKLRLVLDLNLPVTYSWDQNQNEMRVTIK